jgi:3-oxoacyl-[acyl-carrier-protein] synthase III
VLTGNLGRMMRSFLAMAAALPVSRIYAPDVDTTGHCFAADMLIGLQSLAAEGQVASGDRVLLLPTSPESWYAIAVEYVE